MKTKNQMFKSLICLSLFAMTGCATDIGSQSYADASVGSVADTQEGVVLKVRTVKVAPDKLSENHAGMIGGGLAGGLIGSQISSGLPGAIATVGLAGAGAVGGAAAEQALNTQKGLEITVRLHDGTLKTLVQGNDVLFKKGEHVLLVVYSRGRSKVVKEDDETSAPVKNAKT